MKLGKKSSSSVDAVVKQTNVTKPLDHKNNKPQVLQDLNVRSSTDEPLKREISVSLASTIPSSSMLKQNPLFIGLNSGTTRAPFKISVPKVAVAEPSVFIQSLKGNSDDDSKWSKSLSSMASSKLCSVEPRMRRKGKRGGVHAMMEDVVAQSRNVASFSLDSFLKGASSNVNHLTAVSVFDSHRTAQVSSSGVPVKGDGRTSVLRNRYHIVPVPGSGNHSPVLDPTSGCSEGSSSATAESFSFEVHSFSIPESRVAAIVQSWRDMISEGSSIDDVSQLCFSESQVNDEFSVVVHAYRNGYPIDVCMKGVIGPQCVKVDADIHSGKIVSFIPVNRLLQWTNSSLKTQLIGIDTSTLSSGK